MADDEDSRGREEGWARRIVQQLYRLEESVDAPDEVGSTYDHGTIAGATRVPATEVPPGYPVQVETTHAVKLAVAVADETTVAVYLEWPTGQVRNTALERLFDAMDHAAEDDDKYRVELTSESGYHAVDIEATEARRSARAADRDEVMVYVDHGQYAPANNLVRGGCLLGVVVLLLVPLSPAVVGGPLMAPESIPALGLGVSAWWTLLIGVRNDVGNLRFHFDWSRWCYTWLLGVAVPATTVPVGVAYYIHRESLVRNFGERTPADVWSLAVIGSLLLVGATVAWATAIPRVPLALASQPGLLFVIGVGFAAWQFAAGE